MKYKIVILDLDDTLINNKESIRGAFAAVLEKAGHQYTESDFERWHALDKKYWEDWQDKLIQIPDDLKHETGKKSKKFTDWVRSNRFLIYFDNSISQNDAVELNQIYINSLHNNAIEIDGARDMLQYLHKKYKILIATNGPSAAAMNRLDKIGCSQYVSDLFAADMFGHMKPSVDFFKAIEKYYSDYDRSDYIVVGDSLKNDVGFGMNCRIDSCWLNPYGEMADADYAPTYTISRLSELCEIL